MEQKVKITGITSLIEDLKEVYINARSGMLRGSESRKIANVANTIIRAAAQKLAYNEYMNKNEKIDFLEN